MSARAASQSPPNSGTHHEDDLYTWVQEQVSLLRAGRLDEVDAENVAEELSDVGKSEFSKMQSALEIVLTHLLTWDHQPERISRSWANSIAAQRRHYGDVLVDNPGLKPRRSQALERAYAQARLQASSETGLPSGAFPADCSYTLSDVLERSFEYQP